MIVDAVYPWLDMYTKKEASLCLVKQKLQFKLATMGVSFQDDLWMDILKHIAMSPTGWQDVQVVWQNANFSQVGNVMDMVFGEQFVQEEWEDIFDPMYQVWVEEEEVTNPWTHETFEEILMSNYDHDMHLFDLGVIDLMRWKNNDNSTEAGPSKLSQDSDGSTDTESLNISQEGNAKAGPLRVLQKGYNSIKAGQKISQKNPFLDLYVAEDEEESTDTDTGSDTPAASPLKVSEVLPARWTTFASCVNDICCHYEGGYTRHAGLNVSLGSLCHYSLILPTSSPDANLHVYKVDVMTEDITLLYSPHEVFASAFWVQVKHGIYHNNVSYVLSHDGDKVDILVAPQEHPYDTNHWKMLEVVKLPHPDDLTFHVLAGINPSLIHWTIAMFSAQLWKEGDLVHLIEGELVNTSGRIVSVDLQNQSAVINIDSDGGLVAYSCLISHLQCVHRHGDWVKIFAGPDRGIEGCIVNYVGENLTLMVCQHGENIKVQADPILVHLFSHRVSEITPHDQLDSYTHDPKPPQNPIQIGDCAMAIYGPQTGLVGRIMWVALPIMWVEHIGNIHKLKCNELVSLGCQSSIISMLGYPNFQIKNTDVVTR
ncbi:hypothetical protein V8B97DRAFT_2026177 [Scleroderma yunnanense]